MIKHKGSKQLFAPFMLNDGFIPYNIYTIVYLI
jgi:hypothetical protein